MSKPDNKPVTVGVRVSFDLRDRLLAAADAANRTPTALARIAIEEKLSDMALRAVRKQPLEPDSRWVQLSTEQALALDLWARIKRHSPELADATARLMTAAVEDPGWAQVVLAFDQVLGPRSPAAAGRRSQARSSRRTTR